MSARPGEQNSAIADLIEICSILHNDLALVAVTCAIEHYRRVNDLVNNNDTTDLVAELTTSELAELTNMSRETLRRKLLVLKQYGLVKRDARGWRIAASKKGAKLLEFFNDFSDASVGDISKLLSAVKKLLIDLDLDGVVSASASSNRWRSETRNQLDSKGRKEQP